uniref:Uncharacterized protein n=1 Tax=Tetraselmis sp. GSL018 TaxID=582737 RepID=A0A061SB75_9CHLO
MRHVRPDQQLADVQSLKPGFHHALPFWEGSILRQVLATLLLISCKAGSARRSVTGSRFQVILFPLSDSQQNQNKSSRQNLCYDL